MSEFSPLVFASTENKNPKALRHTGREQWRAFNSAHIIDIAVDYHAPAIHLYTTRSHHIISHSDSVKSLAKWLGIELTNS